MAEVGEREGGVQEMATEIACIISMILIAEFGERGGPNNGNANHLALH